MDLARFQDDHSLEVVSEHAWVERGVYILHADWHIHARFGHAARDTPAIEEMLGPRLVYTRSNVRVPTFIPPPNLPTGTPCTLRRCTAAALDTLAQCEHQMSLVRACHSYPLTHIAFIVGADYQCMHVMGTRMGEMASSPLGSYPLLPPFLSAPMHLVFDMAAFGHLVHVAKQLVDMGQVDEGSVLVLGLGETGRKAQRALTQTAAIMTEARGPMARCELVQVHRCGGD